MGKRKHRPVLHQQEQCDVWLSTAEKKEQTPAAKRQKLFRPITNIPDLIISSQPIKVGTKQTDIKNFFAPKSATAKENVVPSECVSKKSHTSAPSRNKGSAKELLGYRRPDTTASFKSYQNDAGKYRSAIGIKHPGNCSLLESEPHLIHPVSKIDKDKFSLLHDERESDIFSSSQDLCDLFKDSQGIPQITRDNEESEDVTFTMGTQGCLKVKGPKAKQCVEQNSFGRQECLKDVEVDSEVAADPNESLASSTQTDHHSDLAYSRDASRFENVNVTESLKSTDVCPNDIPTSVQLDSSEIEESEDITFILGTQRCLMVKQSKTNGSVHSDTNNKRECINAFPVGSELFAKQGDIPDSVNSQSNQASAATIVPFLCDSSEREESEDIIFTVGTQGCLKVKESRKRHANYNALDVQEKFEIDDVNSELSATQDDIDESQPLLSWKLSQDVASTMGSQEYLKIKDHKGHRSVVALSEDSSQDVAFTMGSQGCLKVRDSRQYCSVGKPSEDSSQDRAFTMGSQGCLNVRDHTDQRSSITPSEDSSQDEAFTVGSQGCLKVRDPKGQRSNMALSEYSSQDVDFTMGSQGCLKVRDNKGQRSNTTLSEDSSQDVAITVGSQGCLKVRDDRDQRSNITLSEHSSQDVDFTMGSQGCLKVRDDRGQRSDITLSEDSSQDVAFTMGSQGCLKVRDSKDQRSNITPSEDLSKDIAFTMGSQDCLKVRDSKGQRSNFTTLEDSFQDVAFTMGSQGCLKVRDDRGQRSNITLSEDSSQDVDFTMGSQGCLKVRKDKGQRSSIMQHSNLSKETICLDGDGDKDNDDYDDDDEFSQTQDW